VEKLARQLRVTKGSFYWHFKDRKELLELLLGEWENEVQQILRQLPRGPAEARFQALINLLQERAALSVQGEVPSDAAIFAWASVDPAVARRVNSAEKQRIRLLTRLTGQADRMEIFYLVWLGFVARGQRAPESRKRFPEIARMVRHLLAPSAGPLERVKKNARSNRARA
jgi:AcrR family transcriptional regulator